MRHATPNPLNPHRPQGSEPVASWADSLRAVVHGISMGAATTMMLEATRGVVVHGAATAGARPELATRASPGERRPAGQRRASGSLTHLLVLNVVLVVLAAAGVAWVLLS